MLLHIFRKKTKKVLAGGTVAASIERERRGSAAFRAEYDRLAGFEQLARIVIMRRAQLELSQEELAERMGPPRRSSRGSKADSTRRAPGPLSASGRPSGGHAVIGFDFGSAKRPKRELVAI